MDSFSLISFACWCARQRMDNFSLRRSLVPKLVMPAFGQGKCVRLYGRQGKLVYKKYFYGFGKQNAALTRDKCLTTFHEISCTRATKPTSYPGYFLLYSVHGHLLRKYPGYEDATKLVKENLPVDSAVQPFNQCVQSMSSMDDSSYRLNFDLGKKNKIHHHS